MANDLFVALYVYGDDVIIDVETPDLLTLFALEPPAAEGKPFATTEQGTLATGRLTVTNGVYGWFHDKPVTLTIDGEAAVITKARGRGKDPWPPPPPPPPRFAEDAEAKRRWAEHAVGPDWFMSAIGDPTPGGRSPRRRERTSQPAPGPAGSSPSSTKRPSSPKPSPAKPSPAKRSPAKSPAKRPSPSSAKRPAAASASSPKRRARAKDR